MSRQTRTKAERIAAATPINQRALLTRPMACDYLSVSLNTFKGYESVKDIVGIPIGTGVEKRYRRCDLDDLIEAMATQSTKLDRLKVGAK
ncbi:hypothetical protein K227x_63960 [Rubripirellula lacrimiformis]|uniref:Helix-turn-helix domain protein n=1 Tax=Rubripirellula lacrimiformis TaxID=1930273 RepID=A0A517NLF5_9BACT|nr:hypothetical protein [Rubripirellula lacrimiformis]QDT07966.1 hypothetical protein K227x_63960 [Rubripirellula lacrimiformis]